MPDKKQVYTYICEDCGAVISSVRKKRVLKCDKCQRNDRARRNREETSSPYIKPKHNNEDILKDVYEVDKYNLSHNTKYSYGQFKIKKYLGKI